MIVVMAAIIAMAISAKIAVPLPFTPVPVTLQVFTVIMCGLLLGSKRAFAAQAGYLALILAGIPLAAGPFAGPLIFTSPTAGYLIGFIPAAFAVGYCREKLGKSLVASFLSALSGMVVIYAFGTIWLSYFVGSVANAWTLGVAPFVLIDLVKVTVAAFTFSALKGVQNG